VDAEGGAAEGAADAGLPSAALEGCDLGREGAGGGEDEGPRELGGGVGRGVGVEVRGDDDAASGAGVDVDVGVDAALADEAEGVEAVDEGGADGRALADEDEGFDAARRSERTSMSSTWSVHTLTVWPASLVKLGRVWRVSKVSSRMAMCMGDGAIRNGAARPRVGGAIMLTADLAPRLPPRGRFAGHMKTRARCSGDVAPRWRCADWSRQSEELVTAQRARSRTDPKMNREIESVHSHAPTHGRYPDLCVFSRQCGAQYAAGAHAAQDHV
jgi:hypothetical protein